MSLSPGTRLGSYEILAPLGAGGMGEVWRAKDGRIDRTVALKVLPEEFFENEERRGRFEREARTLGSLNHPGIAALYSFEEVPGPSSGSQSSRHILVMELVDGEPLSKRLKAGTIPMAEALAIGRDIAAALEAAHAKGIAHRDLKPGNVMISKDGRVKLLDFGLAKAFGEDVAPEDLSHSPTITDGDTSAGVILGTAAYMSPEQARGQRVDARTDIWAFGVVLWELLTGKRLFRGQSTPDTLAAVLHEPIDLRALPLSTPRAVQDLLAKCLERDSAKRLPSIGEARRALESAKEGNGISRLVGLRLASTVGVLVLVATGGAFLLRRSHESPGQDGGVKRVAVLPFENLGPAEDEYFADGVADEIRGKITSLPGLEVIARASSTPYKKTTKTPIQIAQELGVKYLLTATVRWEKGTGSGASRVHVSPELVEVKASGAPASKWQQSFDAALSDVFRVQSEIATGVAHALGVALGSGEAKRLADRPTQNLAAWDAFLKGEEASKTGLTSQKALEFYQQAVALDPRFAQAWARISGTSQMLHKYGTPTNTLADLSREAAEKAVALAPERPEGHLALGQYYEAIAGDRNRATAEFDKAKLLAPDSLDVLLAQGWFEMELGRWDAVVDHFKHAARLDPRSVNSHSSLGTALFFLRRYPESREVFDRGLALAPTNLYMIENRAETYLGVGDLDGARASLRSAPKDVAPTELVAFVANIDALGWVLDEEQRELLVRLSPSAFSDNRAAWGICLAQAYALKGDTANVRKYAEEARKEHEERLRRKDVEDPSCDLGLALAYLGRKEEAVRNGERCLANAPASENAFTGPYILHHLARIYILVGEPEKAIDQIEAFLKIPYFVSPAWLRIDPTFDPLRKNPRFQKLAAAH